MNKDTVSAILDALAARGLLRMSKGGGKTTEYVLTEPSEWTVPQCPEIGDTDCPESGDSEQDELSEDRGHTVRIEGTPTVRNEGTKGNPIGNPSKAIPDGQTKESHFPKIENVKAYASEQSIPETQATEFFDYYEARGWKIRGEEIANWQALLRTWSRKAKEYRSKQKESRTAEPFWKAHI